MLERLQQHLFNLIKIVPLSAIYISFIMELSGLWQMLSSSLILIKTLLICFVNEHFTKEFIFKKHISINPLVPSK